MFPTRALVAALTMWLALPAVGLAAQEQDEPLQAVEALHAALNAADVEPRRGRTHHLADRGPVARRRTQRAARSGRQRAN